MIPEVVKYRVWNLALRKNPQTATYNTRTINTAINGTDPLTPYSLLRLTYDEPTTDELSMLGATLADSVTVWYIYQVDLDQASAPTPMIGYELTLADGTTWVIKSIRKEVMQQAFRCVCDQGRPQ